MILYSICLLLVLALNVVVGFILLGFLELEREEREDEKDR